MTAPTHGYEDGVKAERQRITEYLVAQIGRHRAASRKHRWRDLIAKRFPDDDQARYLTLLVAHINGWDGAMAESYVRVALSPSATDSSQEASHG